MKTIFKLQIVLVIAVITTFAQPQLFTNNASTDVVQLDSRASAYEFVPGDILVKFKDDVRPALAKSNGIQRIGVASVDAILTKYSVTEAEKLFKNARPEKSKQILKTFSGKEFEKPNLHNIYKLKLENELNMYEAIEALKQDENVEYAEPNYIFSIVESQPQSDVLTEEQLKDYSAKHISNIMNADSLHVIVPNDPLYPLQWWISATQVDAVWDTTTGDSSQLIGIIDTGIDWHHPDLRNKIWVNPDEIPDNGIDDDHNGFIDDVRGWDWINNDNNPMDDNSHGTHVAGIAAAEANNGIGIAGVNWQAKVIPIKVFQSSGRGDVATITQGIIYATQKGAAVINMSFGSYARSLTMENALANAYATSILVAAAGNDSRCIGPGAGCAPFFPAAFSFVLGVEAPEGGFSNYDQDGPTYSLYDDLLNYEMKAPGTNMMSTIPNGNYRVYQGTSMAAPIISGALSLYRKLIPIEEETPEFMWVKLIQATEQYLDIYKALTIVPKPEVWFLNNVMVDTLGTDDKDGRVDAGETIQLWFRARNTGGQVDSVYWKIKLAEFEDTTTCEIIKPTSYLGSISPYATRTSEKDPMVFKISSNVAHDRDITFDLLSWYKGATDILIRKFVFTAENGEQLSGVLDGVKILYPNRLYLVNNSFKVGTNGTLIIKPGTKILFYPGQEVRVKGVLIAEGKPDSLICFSGYSPPGSWGGISTIFSFDNAYSIRNRFNYCKFDNIGKFTLSRVGGSPASVFNSIFNVGAIGIVDSLVNNNCHFPGQGYGNTGIVYGFSIAYRNNFIGPGTSKDYYYNQSFQHVSFGGNYQYNNIFNYSIPEMEWTNPLMQNAWISEYSKPSQQWNGTFYKDVTQIYTKYTPNSYSSADFQKVQYQYWGTSDSTIIEGFIYDFMERSTLSRAIFKPFLNSPPDSCHAIVWKVIINGKDAQDQEVEPVGVGKQRFDVYFNRPMDKSIPPNVSFGVRYPFSTNAINEDGSWSEDGRIYTVYKTVKLYTGDGINRIRVTGAKDLEGWEIPTEDMRFEFLINAAGSASAEFMASAGLGKVNLEWRNPPEIPDLLGFNMYRFEHLTDTTFTTPEMVNTSLVMDTLFTDFSVTPNKKYYYYYRVVRTDFSESDSSHVVSCTPFTAAPGDANGSLGIDVLDVVSIVSYILNQNPQPFILEAADINKDGSINVLDVIGVVNLILGGAKKDIPKPTAGSASMLLAGNKLEISSDVAVAGIQFKVKRTFNEDLTFNPSSKLSDLEYSYVSLNDSESVYLFYSLKGRTLPSGGFIAGYFSKDQGFAITEAILAGQSGNNITTGIVTGVQGKIPESFYLNQNYPNPFNAQTIIKFGLPDRSDVKIYVYNLIGQRVKAYSLGKLNPGTYQVIWDGKNESGAMVASGVYLYHFESEKFSKTRKLLLMK